MPKISLENQRLTPSTHTSPAPLPVHSPAWAGRRLASHPPLHPQTWRSENTLLHIRDLLHTHHPINTLGILKTHSYIVIICYVCLCFVKTQQQQQQYNISVNVHEAT